MNAEEVIKRAVELDKDNRNNSAKNENHDLAEAAKELGISEEAINQAIKETKVRNAVYCKGCKYLKEDHKTSEYCLCSHPSNTRVDSHTAFTYKTRCSRIFDCNKNNDCPYFESKFRTEPSSFNYKPLLYLAISIPITIMGILLCCCSFATIIKGALILLVSYGTYRVLRHLIEENKRYKIEGDVGLCVWFTIPAILIMGLIIMFPTGKVKNKDPYGYDAEYIGRNSGAERTIQKFYAERRRR